jgi:signal transduction histidine kinase
VFYLVQNKPQADQERYFALAQQETARIARIVRQLLDLYRPAASEDCINLSALIERVLVLIDATVRKQRIEIERAFAPDLPLVWGYTDQLTQVMLNIIVNAIQAMPTGGKLRLETCAANDGAAPLAAARVGDTGFGIPEEQLSRIFTPFFTTKRDGTGLGLALCAEIVAEHRGRITVESTPGRGSTFTVLLPALNANSAGDPEGAADAL